MATSRPKTGLDYVFILFYTKSPVAPTEEHGASKVQGHRLNSQGMHKLINSIPFIE